MGRKDNEIKGDKMRRDEGRGDEDTNCSNVRVLAM